MDILFLKSVLGNQLDPSVLQMTVPVKTFGVVTLQALFSPEIRANFVVHFLPK